VDESKKNKKQIAKDICERLEAVLRSKVPSQDSLDLLNISPPHGEMTKTWMDVFVYQLVLKACAGNDKSISEIFDRVMGKPAQYTENITKTYNYTDFLVSLQKETGSIEPVSSRRLLPIDEEEDNTQLLSDLGLD